MVRSSSSSEADSAPSSDSEAEAPEKETAASPGSASDSDAPDQAVKKKGKRPAKDSGKAKGTKRKKLEGDPKGLLDDEAAESGDDGGQEEEEEDEEKNEYERDGFVVGDDEFMSDEERKSAPRRKMKKLTRLKKVSATNAVDEEDLELIRDAHGAGPLEVDDEERGGGLLASNADELGAQLFGGAVDTGPAGAASSHQRHVHDDEFNSEDDDFIEDDIGLYESERRRERQRQRPGAGGMMMDPMRQAQVDEAMDIFGDGILEFMEGGAMQEEEAEQPGGAQARRRKHAMIAGIEPGMLREKFITATDEEIQAKDMPERLQMRLQGRGEIDDREREEEAEWILPQLHLADAADPWAPKDDKPVLAAIQKVLYYLVVEGFEVPFIYSYRKDYFHPHLGLNDLWRIYDLDEEWERLASRRDKVSDLAQAFWRLLGDEVDDTDIGDEDAFASEDEGDREERERKEMWMRESREERLRNAQRALERAKAAPSAAAALTATSTSTEEGKDIEGGEGDSSGAAAADAPMEVAVDEQRAEKIKTAEAHLEGLMGELAIAEEEEAAVEEARSGRRRERRDAALAEKRRKREEAKESLKEVADLLPKSYDVLLIGADEERMRDLQNYIALVTLAGQKKEEAAVEGGSRNARALRASRADRDLYRSCRKHPALRTLALSFVISAPVLGRVVSSQGFNTAEVPTPTEDPHLAAAAVAGELSDVFKDDEKVLKATRHMLACEVAAEPQVKAACRHYFRTQSVVTTNPTDLGKQEIDFFHPLYGLHYLHGKPLLDLLHAKGDDATLFVKLERAQKDGFVKLEILPPQKRVDGEDSRGNPLDEWEVDVGAFTALLEPYYQPESMDTSEEGSDVREQWREQRSLILREAVGKLLIPALLKETVQELRKSAREATVQEAAAALGRRLQVGPWVPRERTPFDRLCNEDTRRRQLDAIKAVGVFVTGESRKPSFCVALDPTGEVTDYLVIPGQRSMVEKALKDFIVQAKPDVIVINSGAGAICRAIGQKLLSSRKQFGGVDEPPIVVESGIVAEALHENKQLAEADDFDDFDAELWTACEVFHACDDCAKIFATSTRGVKEFPEYDPALRAAIALARDVQDPLPGLAGMWSTMDSRGRFGEEMLHLRMHPLQKEVPKERLLRAYEQQMISAVNEVGVDVNLACEKVHQRSLLRFVAGLGPRKADALVQGVAQLSNAVVSDRKQLLKLLGPLVYTNAVGFLRVQPRGRLEGSEDLVPFDKTRIHPECYEKHHWARQICANALDVEQDDYIHAVAGIEDDSREVLESTLAANPSWDPASGPELKDKLEELDLQQFAAELESQGQGTRLLQLEAIKEELRFPYLDRRTPKTAPTDNELFEMLSGESDETLRPGMVVTCRITSATAGGLRARIEGSGGLFAFIKMDCITDDVLPMDEDPTSLVPVNAIREAVITSIRKERFEVSLSLKKSDLMQNTEQWSHVWERPESLPPVDATYFNEAEAKKAYEAAQVQRQKSILASSAKQAKRAVVGKSKMFSRSVIHENFKNVTSTEAEAYLKDQALGDVLFRPSSKGPSVLTMTWMWVEGDFKHLEVQEIDKPSNPRLLGTKLRVKGEDYEDLDEILARWVAPCNDVVADMIDNSKFRTGNLEEVTELLANEKAANSRRIPYFFLQHQCPGYFQLAYQPVNKVKTETIEVTPSGLKMRSTVHRNVRELTTWFKKNAHQMGRKPRSKSKPSGSSSSSGQPQPPLPPANDPGHAQQGWRQPIDNGHQPPLPPQNEGSGWREPRAPPPRDRGSGWGDKGYPPPQDGGWEQRRAPHQVTPPRSNQGYSNHDDRRHEGEGRYRDRDRGEGAGRDGGNYGGRSRRDEGSDRNRSGGRDRQRPSRWGKR
ncbi:unnamed protein product [Chrysoparadoxa australica]